MSRILSWSQRVMAHGCEIISRKVVFVTVTLSLVTYIAQQHSVLGYVQQRSSRLHSIGESFTAIHSLWSKQCGWVNASNRLFLNLIQYVP
jgi:hypothetical protein